MRHLIHSGTSPFRITAAVFLLGCAAIVFAAAGCSGNSDGKNAHAGETVAESYYCPMHPQVVSDKPGVCPICQMDLVKKGSESPGAAQEARQLHLTASGEVLANVSTLKAERTTLKPEVSAYCVLEIPDQNRKVIAARFGGRIEKLRIDRTGQAIQTGDPLFEIYSPELVQAQQEHLLALKRTATASAGADPVSGSSLASMTRAKLSLLGITETQIRDLEQAGEPRMVMTYISPANGIVLEKGVREGMYVSEGTSLYEIADLSSVWSVAEVNQAEVGTLHPGISALIRLDAYPGRMFSGIVSFVSPVVNPQTRTIQVRTVLDNRSGTLRPNMWGTATFSLQQLSGIMIPKEAVLMTGPRAIVWVKTGDRTYTPRTVRLGERLGNRYRVLEGLSEGDEYAATGGYLIDSESQLQTANTAQPEQQPAAHGRMQADSHTQDSPAKESGKIIFNAVCPVLGEAVDEDAPTVIYKGKLIGFCCPGCDTKFKKDPEKYMKNLSPDGKRFLGKK